MLKIILLASSFVYAEKQFGLENFGGLAPKFVDPKTNDANKLGKLPSDLGDKIAKNVASSCAETDYNKSAFDFSKLAEKVGPSVVKIYATQLSSAKDEKMPFGFAFGGALEEFFRDMMPKEYNERPRRTESMGSGFVIYNDPEKKQCIIVTSLHVVDNAKQITITLQDGTELDGQLMAGDDGTDIALVQVATDKLPDGQLNIPTLKFGDSSKVKTGEWVAAFGYPFNLEQSFSQGIISNAAQKVFQKDGTNKHSSLVPDFLQHTASINMGNSGGPLFNLKGEVIGINTSILTPNGGNVGIGLAVPINAVRGPIIQMAQHGKVRRGMIGIVIQGITKEMAKSFGKESYIGTAIVTNIRPNSPGEKAGIRQGDIIIKFGDTPLSNKNNLAHLVANAPIGKPIEILVIRNNKEVKLTIVTEERESTVIDVPETSLPAALSESKEVLGMRVSNIPDDVKKKMSSKQLGNEEIQGVIIAKIDPQSQAADWRLKPGDIILSVNLKDIKNIDDFVQTLKDEKNKATSEKPVPITMYLLRAGEKRFETFLIESDPIE